MGFGEKRADYWRGRYRLLTGEHATVKDASGSVIRFRTKREAERAANLAEAKVRANPHRHPDAGRTAFGAYASAWYASQDLAASTMQNYRRHIEEHLLPTFENRAIADILRADIESWEKGERAAGYAEASIKTWRATLHLILADAVEDGLRDSNPADRRHGRGRRAGRSRGRGPEKVITSPLGILLIAERSALLSGRDDEFVAVILKAYSGMRWAELVGLETRYMRTASVRVEWQLYELDNGELHRCPPKDDSHRTVDVPEWLSKIVADHIAATKPNPCHCHGLTYVFRGHGAARPGVRQPGPKLVDVAKHAGVSAATVSAVFNRPESVRPVTRAKVESAVMTLGYVRGAQAVELAPHWRRNGYATWLFQPAVTGWYPKKAPYDAHPVPVLGGGPVRGRNASARADSCWLPIAPGLTPHGLRHTHKTLMEELSTPGKLMDDRLGHLDGSVQARYTHITATMRSQLLAGLTGMWLTALDERLLMTPTSAVPVLDRLLAARRLEVGA